MSGQIIKTLDTVPEPDQTQGKHYPDRRQFIHTVGLCLVGGLVLPPALWVPSSARASVIHQPIPPAEGRITQLNPYDSACADCGTCEEACALVHDQTAGPQMRRIWVQRAPFDGYTTIDACHQCEDPRCYHACPVGALYIDPITGARCIDETKCVGCRRCYHACPFDPPRINFDFVRHVSLKCDLCKDRPDGPACVQFCQQQVLKLSS